MKEVINELKLLPGKPYPLGANEVESSINFAIYIKDAFSVTLCLFDENNQSIPFQEIKLDPQINRTGQVWHIAIGHLPDYPSYAYRVVPLRDKTKSFLLLDPYAKAITSHSEWQSLNQRNQPYRPLGKVIPADYDWEGDRFPKIPPKDLVIYEMHLRGFTKDPSSQTKHPGTFLGVIEKIPYLKSLGVNALEFLPLFEFNECETLLVNPTTNERLCNYFGYSTVNFFSPMNRFSSQSHKDEAILEFRSMVKELHKNGIEVILDVVFNHTFEGGPSGPVMSFRGLDPHSYYMIDQKGNYLNFSGCGNTVNSNNPIVIELIIASLRYWVVEMHVDGFRFDLASIMTRGKNGTPLNNAPLVKAISQDPILADTKLIAEAWDAAGLYQVGGFYHGVRWNEWNGKYRDIVRRFIKGDSGNKKAFATAISGSQDLYGWRGSPLCSVNFVTAHDGFSLADLVSYNQKNNIANGENNKDGFDYNDSWNCGEEGPTNKEEVIALREKQMRNFILALLVSQGIPMILMGDEYAHSRNGNNNTWCQDNELNWFRWDQVKGHSGLFNFLSSLIAFRKNEPLLRHEGFLSDKDVTWHGIVPEKAEWDNEDGFVAFTLNSPEKIPKIYVAFNASHIPLKITIPSPGKGQTWYWVVNTALAPKEDFFDEKQHKKVESENYEIAPNSALMFKAFASK